MPIRQVNIRGNMSTSTSLPSTTPRDKEFLLSFSSMLSVVLRVLSCLHFVEC